MFDFNEIEDFDKHINISIPGYKDLISQIIQYSEYFIEKGTNVYDIGCSTGNLIKSFPRLEANYIGIDNSDLIPEGKEFIKADIAKQALSNASFIVSVFTLQFLARKDRNLIIKKIKNALNPGGAFILCEKIYADSGRIQDITNSLYYQFKMQGFPGGEILKKEQELRSAIRPMFLSQLLQEAVQIGQYDIFWKKYNFIGLIILKNL